MSFLPSVGDIWKLFVRPPRIHYHTDQLGPPDFFVRRQRVIRNDFILYNCYGDTLQCSIYEPYVQVYHDGFTPPNPAVCLIYLHGNGGSRLDGRQVVDLVIEHGISVMTFDFSGCGLSSGEFVTLGLREKDDVSAVIDHLISLRKFQSFILWGRSMGTAAAMMFLGSRFDVHHMILCVILDSPFSSVRAIAETMCEERTLLPSFLIDPVLSMLNDQIFERARIDISRIEPIHELNKFSIPTLFAVASHDGVTKPMEVHKVYSAYRGPKDFVEFEGDHNSSRYHQFFGTALGFIMAHLPMMRMDRGLAWHPPHPEPMLGTPVHPPPVQFVQAVPLSPQISPQLPIATPPPMQEVVFTTPVQQMQQVQQVQQVVVVPQMVVTPPPQQVQVQVQPVAMQAVHPQPPVTLQAVQTPVQAVVPHTPVAVQTVHPQTPVSVQAILPQTPVAIQALHPQTPVTVHSQVPITVQSILPTPPPPPVPQFNPPQIQQVSFIPLTPQSASAYEVVEHSRSSSKAREAAREATRILTEKAARSRSRSNRRSVTPNRFSQSANAWQKAPNKPKHEVTIQVLTPRDERTPIYARPTSMTRGELSPKPASRVSLDRLHSKPTPTPTAPRFREFEETTVSTITEEGKLSGGKTARFQEEKPYDTSDTTHISTVSGLSHIRTVSGPNCYDTESFAAVNDKNFADGRAVKRMAYGQGHNELKIEIERMDKTYRETRPVTPRSTKNTDRTERPEKVERGRSRTPTRDIRKRFACEFNCPITQFREMKTEASNIDGNPEDATLWNRVLNRNRF
eukprot:TRINITY_DN3254_c0_g1_i2.p1 TRINITY_DN3254_c0_g1~~TRINITY_DN3254_c0_g1_i2.p1  ORF type:complete len:793 (-),score=107.00 TRINITY_DN3254_c0_g1_i2:142-2520(-)